MVTHGGGSVGRFRCMLRVYGSRIHVLIQFSRWDMYASLPPWAIFLYDLSGQDNNHLQFLFILWTFDGWSMSFKPITVIFLLNNFALCSIHVG